MSDLIEIKLPDIGDFDEVDVIEVLVSEGDAVQAEQSLITVESDKASMEIPSPQGGVVQSLIVKLGDKLKQGSVILKLKAADGDAAAGKAATEEKTVAGTASKAAPAAPPASQASGTARPAEPAQAGSGQSAEGEAPTESVIIVAVPDIGDATDVEVIEIMVSVGDTVAKDQSLITVESDKASMEVPSSHAGVITAIKVKLGDKVSEGTEILEVASTQGGSVKADGSQPTEQAPAVAPSQKAEQPVPDQDASAQVSTVAGSSQSAPMSKAVTRHSPTAAYAADAVTPTNLPHASPSVRKFARELGVDLSAIKGSGAKYRITKDDVRQYVKQFLSAGAGSAKTLGGGGFDVMDWPKIDFTKFGSIETRPLSRIKKISGANLHRNWVMIPHVTNNDAADITDLEALRVTLNRENQKEGVKVTMLAFLIKAVVAALKKFPEVNASLDGDNLVLKQYFHIGFAADTPNGLVVPVIRDADQKGILDIARETVDLSALAREGKLSPGQMQGGCFSISSLGGIGGTSFTPIINAPEVAILGVSRSAQTPVWDGKKFRPRLMLPLSLSYDHRVVDGAMAARFNAYLCNLLADFRRIVL